MAEITVAACDPVTSPPRLPVNVAAEPLTLPVTLPVCAPVVLPIRFALMVPALKLPLASRLTIVLTVFKFVAALAVFAPLTTFAAVMPPKVETTELLDGPVTSPERVTPPTTAPGMFPLLSRLTIELGVLAVVAALAALTPLAMLVALRPPTDETVVSDCVPFTSP